MAQVTVGATGNPFFNNYGAILTGNAGDTYKVTGNFPPNGTGLNYSSGGTASYSAGDNHIIISGLGATNGYVIAFSFQKGTTTSGDPHVKPLDDDDYTL